MSPSVHGSVLPSQHLTDISIGWPIVCIANFNSRHFADRPSAQLHLLRFMCFVFFVFGLFDLCVGSVLLLVYFRHIFCFDLFISFYFAKMLNNNRSNTRLLDTKREHIFMLQYLPDVQKIVLKPRLLGLEGC